MSIMFRFYLFIYKFYFYQWIIYLKTYKDHSHNLGKVNLSKIALLAFVWEVKKYLIVSYRIDFQIESIHIKIFLKSTKRILYALLFIRFILSSQNDNHEIFKRPKNGRKISVRNSVIS